MDKPALLICNEAAGAGKPDCTDEVRAGLAAVPHELAFTTPQLSAKHLALEAIRQGRPAVIVAGGDGTVSQVASALVETDVPLGVIPAGTFNNIARSLHMPEKIADACAVIAAGHTRDVDAGLADGERYFFEAVGAGLDAALFPLGEKVKQGKWAALGRIFRILMGYRTHRFHLTFDTTVADAAQGMRGRMPQAWTRSQTVRLRALFVVASNGPYYGSAFTVSPEARMRDGLLTVSVYRNFTKPELLAHFASIAGGRLRYSPKVQTFHARKVTLGSHSPLPVHADGHRLGRTPVKLTALPGALRVFAPKT